MTTYGQWLVATAQTVGQNASALTNSVASEMSQALPLAPTEPTRFDWSNYFQAIAIMLLLLGLLWFLVWALRRYGKLNFIPAPGAFPKNQLRLEAQLPLGPRKGVMVVRFLNTRLLLGVTEHQITFLKEVGLHDDEDDNEQDEQDKAFSSPDPRRNHARTSSCPEQPHLSFEGLLAAAQNKQAPSPHISAAHAEDEGTEGEGFEGEGFEDTSGKTCKNPPENTL